LADAYLNVAERVLLTYRRPMRPNEIIQQAYAQGLLPWHLHGARQDKTLHARISEDIARNPGDGRFFRTGPGIFFLHELVADNKVPDAYKHPFYAPPRKKELRKDRILSLELNSKIVDEAPKIIEIKTITEALDSGKYSYKNFGDLTDAIDQAAIHSFVIVFNEGMVLSYRCGKFTPAADPLYGLRSIGLGGTVYATDLDLLFESMHGIIASGINELGYGIGLPRKLAEQARYGNQVKPYICTILSKNQKRPAVLQVVMAYLCPADFKPSKAALSVNDLRWVPVKNVINDLDYYDETSRMLYQNNEVEKIWLKVSSHG
jgi:hypothetical protein